MRGLRSAVDLGASEGSNEDGSRDQYARPLLARRKIELLKDGRVVKDSNKLSQWQKCTRILEVLSYGRLVCVGRRNYVDQS